MAALTALVLLMMYSSAAQEGARGGLQLCAKVIVPSLLPFFAVSSLLSQLGFPMYLARFTHPAARRIFNVSGAGTSAFIIGVTGGYPMGAAAVADTYSHGALSKEEAQKLLAFCNNSGPAFILGAAGTGIFKSAGVGLFLYAVHIISAVLTGIIMRGKASAEDRGNKQISISTYTFTEAVASSVKNAAASSVTICGFIVFFSAVVSVLDSAGVFSSLAGRLSLLCGVELTQARAFLAGLLELGTGISCLSGVPASPENLALCSFILSWGGLSVHCQTLAVINSSGLSSGKHFIGHCISSVVSAGLTLFFSPLIL